MFHRIDLLLPPMELEPGIKDRDMAGFSEGDNSCPPLSKLETSIDDADCHDDSDRGEFELEQVFPVYAFGFPSPDPGLLPDSDSGDHIWNAIMQEAKSEADKEPILSSFLYASILCHDCLERALGFVLANRLQNPTLLATQLMDIFSDVIMHDKGIQRSLRLDLQAFKDRDSSCLSYCWVLLYLKGYHSLQSYRIAHALWNRGRKVLALALQSRISEVFGVDIHPAARIGEGILLDHATGIVIGETTVIGNRVSIMQGVTLGGTGKELGNRHPNVGDGALIGASANILGNINIGEGAMVAAGSLVLKDVSPHRYMTSERGNDAYVIQVSAYHFLSSSGTYLHFVTLRSFLCVGNQSMVAGIPAKVIGHADELQDPSLTMKRDASKVFFEQAAGSSGEGR